MDWLLSIPYDSLSHWLAQVPMTAPTPDEVDLLKSQIDLLEKAYGNLDETFSRYVTLVQTALAVGGGAVGFVGALGIWIFKDSMSSYRETLNNINAEVDKALNRSVQAEVAAAMVQQQATIQAEVQQRVQTEISLVVRKRITKLEQILSREDIPSQVTIDYVLPVAQNNVDLAQLNLALRVLTARGFDVSDRHLPALQNDAQTSTLPMLNGSDILLLDLTSAQVADTAYNDIIRRTITKLSPEQTALVVFVPSNQTNIRDFPDYYCNAANSLLTLVPRVIEAAYVMNAIE